MVARGAHYPAAKSGLADRRSALEWGDPLGIDCQKMAGSGQNTKPGQSAASIFGQSEGEGARLV